MISLKSFDYPLPEKLIAQYPLKKRDRARMMVVDRKSKEIIHDYFYNIGKYLPQKSLFVLNNSKVIAARLFGKKENGNRVVEVFLLKALEDGYCFQALLKPLKKIKDGEKIFFSKTLYATLADRANMIVRFNKRDVLKYLEKIGHIPLPPYIKREDVPSDKKDYQTVYAKNKGSVASPTAGLHFTKSLLAQLKKKGQAFEEVTLHINYGTFKPVQEDDITKHQMHTEEYIVPSRVADVVLRTRNQKKRIIAVGTTSCRVLESLAKTKKLKDATNLFIYPGFSFKMVDILLTNFHLPKSTLLILVSAFGSVDLIKRAYREAVAKKYRFYSYGDCMLIL